MRIPLEVCLIDVYETLLTVDFAPALGHLAGMARVSTAAFREASNAVASRVTTGDLTMSEAMDRMLRRCRVTADPMLVRDLVEEDRRLLLASARLHDDTIAFLEMLQARGVRSALVSNSAENTRPLLTHLGLDALVDSVVLSCEVGYAKPQAEIYLRALDELGAEPRDAVFVDDQAEYCDGATRIGLAAARIVRGGSVAAAAPAPPGPTIVQSLMELEGFF